MHTLVITTGDFHECTDHTDHSSQKTRHGCDGSNIVEVTDSVRQDTRLAGPLCLSHLTNLFKGSAGVLGHKIERFLGDASDTLVLSVTMCHQPKIITFPDQGLRSVHKLITHHSIAADGKEIE